MPRLTAPWICWQWLAHFAQWNHKWRLCGCSTWPPLPLQNRCPAMSAYIPFCELSLHKQATTTKRPRLQQIDLQRHYTDSVFLPVCCLLCASFVLGKADKNHCREHVFYQPCFAKEHFKEKHSMDVSVDTPLTSWIHCLHLFLLHSFVAFSDPCQVLLYDDLRKEPHTDFLHGSRSGALSYWEKSVTFNLLICKHE